MNREILWEQLQDLKTREKHQNGERKELLADLNTLEISGSPVPDLIISNK